MSKDRTVIIADVSGSMNTLDAGEGKSRFAVLCKALQGLPKEVRIITFSDDPCEVLRAEDVRLIGGGTALHKAIAAAARYEPIRTVIVSDGEPDSEGDALAAAQKLTGIIDVIYCGNPGDAKARAFLQSLARAGAGGFYQTGDQVEINKQLPAVIAGLLGSGK